MRKHSANPIRNKQRPLPRIPFTLSMSLSILLKRVGHDFSLTPCAFSKPRWFCGVMIYHHDHYEKQCRSWLELLGSHSRHLLCLMFLKCVTQDANYLTQCKMLCRSSRFRWNGLIGRLSLNLFLWDKDLCILMRTIVNDLIHWDTINVLDYFQKVLG